MSKGRVHDSRGAAGYEWTIGALSAEAHGFRMVGEIIVIDGGPNRGRQVVYLKGPDGFVIEFIGEQPA